MSKPTPYPIAFEEAIKVILDEPLTKDNAEEIAEDFTGYVSAKIIAAHNQSLQTAVVEALESCKPSNVDDWIKIEEMNQLIDSRIEELTKAKEQSHE